MTRNISLPPQTRILVVEDEPFNQIVFQTIIDPNQIILAENGKIAIDILRKNRFDLILMDIHMPVLDGYSTAKIIRDELGLATPIIAISADIGPGAHQRAIDAGMNDFLAKPYAFAELFKRILAILEPPAPVSI